MIHKQMISPLTLFTKTLPSLLFFFEADYNMCYILITKTSKILI